MRKNYFARRGTSIAAAALSVALVAPLAQPVAFAQETGATAGEAAPEGQNDKKIARVGIADVSAEAAQNAEIKADGVEASTGKKVEKTNASGDAPYANYVGTIQDASGNEIPGSKVTVDPATGEIKVTVPKSEGIDNPLAIETPRLATVTVGEELAANLGMAKVGTFQVQVKTRVVPTPGEGAILSPGTADEISTINGSVKEILTPGVGFGSVQESGKALQGVKVYAQWFEGVNTEHSSPVYYVESDENGNFSLKLAPYVDANGVEREFMADASVGLTTGDASGRRDERREKIRVWAELPDSMQDQYRLVHQPAAGIFPPIDLGVGTVTPGTQGDGQWKGNKVVGMTIQYAQKTALPQHLPKDKWVESTGGATGGYYSGTAFWNMFVSPGALNHNVVSKKGGDPRAAGLTVVGSYLNDEAVKQIHEYVEKNFAGKTLRGGDWTIEDEQGLQKWINEQVAADPEGWIAETVKTTTDANGDFTLYWKGIYGQAWDRKGTVPQDKFHTLASSRDEGTFVNGNHTSKHVNMDWSYVQILDKDGNMLPNNVGMMYPWSLGQWSGPASGNNIQYFGGDGSVIDRLTDYYNAWNVALYPAPLKFDVLEKDTTENFALPGETVETATSGLPVGENIEYYIEWTDKDGNKVGECGPQSASPDTRIPSCPLTVPDSAEHGDTFTARLYQGKDNGGTLLAQDSFAVSKRYLDYDAAIAKPQQEASSTPKFDNPATPNSVEVAPENPEFKLGTLPEGVTEDQVSIDPATGVVTFTPKADQAGKSFDIPVVMLDKDEQVIDRDENGEPKKDAEGNTIMKPRAVANANATFNVFNLPTDNGKGGLADEVTPSWENAKTPAGAAVEVPNTGEEIPAGSTVEASSDKGWAVTTTPDGKVTVTPPASAQTGDKSTVYVKVTYPDGSEDVEKFTVTVQNDDNGDGDATNDGSDADKTTPDWKNAETKPNTPVEVPNTGDKLPADSKVEVPGTVKDADGNDWTVEVKDGDKVVVTPPTNATPGAKVEVPVTVTYPDGSKDNETFTVTVAEDKTRVEGEPKEVEPTNDPQDSGLKIVNKDKDTQVSAKDEDGKDVPVTVGEDGKISVTPGTDVDGPITVTVTDPDLTGGEKPGEQSFEVPVKGHEKGRDDNGSDKTKVEGTPKEVEPTNDPQDSGLKIVNKDDDTKVSAKDEDGKDVPVTVDPETGEIKVTPGTDVDGPITVTVTDPDLPNGEQSFEVPVKGHEKGRDDNGSDTKIIPGTQTDEVPADGKPKELDDKISGPTDGLTGEVKDKDGKVIPDSKVEITPEGDIKVTVPQGTDPQDGSVTIKDKDGKDLGDIAIKITDNTPPAIDNVKSDDKKITGTGDRPNEDITVTFPDGKTETAKTGQDNKFEVPVPADTPLKNGDTVKAKDGNGNESGRKVGATDADTHKPSYGAEDSRTGVKVGESEFSPNPFKTPAPVKDVNVTPSAGADDWKFEAQPQPGVIKATAPSQDVLKAKYEAGEIGNSWDKFVEVFTPVAKPETKVDFTFNDDSTNDAIAKWDLLGKDGKSILDPEGDADGDGHKNKDEVEKGSNPFDENSKPQAPVDPSSDPAWDDKETTPGVKVEIPNKGGNVPAGTTTEVTGPGTAEIKPDGTLVVTPNKDAKPGDTITVVVKDKDGKVLDEVTVTIKEKASAGDKLGETVIASYPKTSVKAGEKQTSKLGLEKKDKTKVAVPSDTTATITNRTGGELGGAKWTIAEAGADVTGQAPTTGALIAEFKKQDVKKDWNQFMTTFKPVATPSVDVKVKNSTGETTAKAGFELVGVDGQSIFDPNGDFDGDGLKNKDEIAKGKNPFDKSDWTVDAGRCAASAIGFGLPLIALLPLGLASQVGIPGLTPIAQRIDAELKNVNTNIQQQLGIFDPALASQVDRVNAQLRAFGADLGTVAAGIVLIAAGILAGTVIYDNCKPGGPTSSVQDAELRGSSGNTVELSSKKEDNAKK